MAFLALFLKSSLCAGIKWRYTLHYQNLTDRQQLYPRPGSRYLFRQLLRNPGIFPYERNYIFSIYGLMFDDHVTLPFGSLHISYIILGTPAYFFEI